MAHINTFRFQTIKYVFKMHTTSSSDFKVVGDGLMKPACLCSLMLCVKRSFERSFNSGLFLELRLSEDG